MGNRKGGKKDKWKGVPLDYLKRLRLKYCRVQTRALLQPNGFEDEREPGDLAGLLLDQIYKWLRSKKHEFPFPTQTEIGKACDEAVKLGVLNKFLNGNATRGKHWFKNARDMLRVMLVGKKPNETSTQYALYRTIEDYFFRKLDPDDPELAPAFFQRRRATPEPCTRRELAGEILWTLYKHQYAGWPAEMVFVSGGWPYFPEGVEKQVAKATAEAARGGVNVTFVRHALPSANETGPNLGDFYETYPAVKEGALAEIDLGDNGHQNESGLSGFLSPVVQHLYLKVTCPDPDKADENVTILYMVRGAKPNGVGPAAHLADPLELRDFELWLATVRRVSAPAVPAVQVVPR
jgi:hypothetical protein